jgi:hypothetical protein
MSVYSMCGVILDNGRDCPDGVEADAPINLCPDHLTAAYEWRAGQRGHDEDIMPSPCDACGERTGREYTAGWICASCGWRSGEPVTTEFRDRVRRLRSLEVVYYIRFSDRVKIGTTRDLRGRLGALPYDELLAIERGGRERERSRHGQFSATRLGQSEWFARSDDLDRHIRVLSAGVDDPWQQYAFWKQRDAS